MMALSVTLILAHEAEKAVPMIELGSASRKPVVAMVPLDLAVSSLMRRMTRPPKLLTAWAGLSRLWEPVLPLSVSIVRLSPTDSSSGCCDSSDILSDLDMADVQAKMVRG